MEIFGLCTAKIMIYLFILTIITELLVNRFRIDYGTIFK